MEPHRPSVPDSSWKVPGHESSRSDRKFCGAVSLELMIFTLPADERRRCELCLHDGTLGQSRREGPLPELSITVNMDPPPGPMLCGLMTEVHSSAAMAPSTAEPPLCRMSLKEFSHHHVSSLRRHCCTVWFGFVRAGADRTTGTKSA